MKENHGEKMSIISICFLVFVGAVGVFNFLFDLHKRSYFLFIINFLFLFLIKANILSVSYLLLSSIFTFLFACLFLKIRNRYIIFGGVFLLTFGLLFFKYIGIFGFSIILPIGISFYTFKMISLLIDCYKGKIKEIHFQNCLIYLMYFPTFLSGPISRYTEFQDELKKPFCFDYVMQKNGFVLMMMGMFEKFVFSSQLFRIIQLIDTSTIQEGNLFLIKVFLYSVYIYADFDAYSNIAIGVSQLIGIKIHSNFKTPYFSNNIKEFWRRWHISLSSWLKDYVYILLGGNRKGSFRKYINILIVFVLSGIWHGSTLMFLIWGIGHGIIYLLEDFEFFQKLSKKKLIKPFFIVLNFIVVSFLWIPFFSISYTQMIKNIASLRMVKLDFHIYRVLLNIGVTKNEVYFLFFSILIFILIDLLRYHHNLIEKIAKLPFVLRWFLYSCCILIAIVFGVYGIGYNPNNFVYVTF